MAPLRARHGANDLLHHRPNSGTLIATARQVGEQPPPRYLSRQTGELQGPARRYAAHFDVRVHRFCDQGCAHRFLRDAPLDPQLQQVAYDSRRGAPARGAGRSEMFGEASIVEELLPGQSLERHFDRGRRMLLLDQPTSQIAASVRSARLGTHGGAVRGLDVGKRLQSAERLHRQRGPNDQAEWCQQRFGQ